MIVALVQPDHISIRMMVYASLVAIYSGCFPFKLCEVENWRSWSVGIVVFFLLPIPHHVGFVKRLPHPDNVNRPSRFGDIPIGFRYQEPRTHPFVNDELSVRWDEENQGQAVGGGMRCEL